MAAHLRGLHHHHEQTIVVCWRHTHLLELAAALGGDARVLPAAWPDTVFGWIIQLDLDAEGHIAATRCFSQRLMVDDREQPIAAAPSFT